MNNTIKIWNAFYEYKQVKVNDYEYYQIQLAVGTYDNGRPKYKRISASTLNELKLKTEKVLETNITQGSEITIKQLAHEFLKMKFNHVAPTTYDRIESVVTAHLDDDIGHYPVKNLDDEKFIQRYVDRLSMCGNVRTNPPSALQYNTIKRILSVISDMSEFAVRYNYIDKNRVKYIVIPKNVKRPKEKKVLSDDDLNRFLKELNKKDKYGNYVHFYRLAILFNLYTGLRNSELFGLKKDMVDLDKRIIYVERTRVRSKKRNQHGDAVGGYKTEIYDETKNASSRRMVPLTEEAVMIMREAFETFPTNELCFPNRDGNIVKPTTFSQKFSNICRQAGTDITPHSIRHTFACNVIYNSNIGIEKLAKILGHSTTKVTYNTYLHQIREKELLLGQELSGLYNVTI